MMQGLLDAIGLGPGGGADSGNGPMYLEGGIQIEGFKFTLSLKKGYLDYQSAWEKECGGTQSYKLCGKTWSKEAWEYITRFGPGTRNGLIWTLLCARSAKWETNSVKNGDVTTLTVHRTLEEGRVEFILNVMKIDGAERIVDQDIRYK